MATDRELVTKWWDEAWGEGLWAASWGKSLEGLTAEQAAWSPAPGRHSIWQLVLHMIFWREGWLRRLATGQKATPEETAKLNFPAVEEVSAPAWALARRRFEETQSRVATALRDGGSGADPMMYFLPHDCYHFGQVNYLRAMQGLPPIE